jgi:hypothetical protein
MSYGALDRHLGMLAALLGRHDRAIAHFRAARDRDAEMGCTAWQEHTRRQLDRLTSRAGH